jgi:hypothetical protein
VTALLERVDWSDVNARVPHEQRNREVYVPPISLFRWWARRPHALIGSLIDAACSDGSTPTLADPFSGGGTVAIEATRRGLPIYAQDLHPWPVAGLATALDGVDADELRAAADEVLEQLQLLRRSLYGTECPAHGSDSELAHVFWVRREACPLCTTVVHLFPYPLVSVASRSGGEAYGHFGCRRCGVVSRHRLSTERPRCSACGATLASADTPLLRDRATTCANPSCRHTFPVFEGEAPEWVPVLVSRLCDGSVHLDRPTPAEADASHPMPDSPVPLTGAIPVGVETGILRRAGFHRWLDVMPPRQVISLLSAAAVVDALGVSESVRARLRLALCGAVEMAGYLSRWDRYYPKAFEAMANHRFPALGLACETNLLGSRGRGTIPRRFAASVAAARWSAENLTIRRRTRVGPAAGRRRGVGDGPLLARGSSERQLPAAQCIDLVITDPPYFDDVQYAELASLLLAWARALNLVPATVELDLGAEAVVNHTRGLGVDEYRSVLTRVFTETARTLKLDGRMLITFHNTDIRAWWALARAFAAASLDVVATAVSEAENGEDHPKRNRRSFTKDLVLECRRSGDAPSPLREICTSEDSQERELRAVGRVVAVGGALSLDDFVRRFISERGEIDPARIQTPTLTPP